MVKYYSHDYFSFSFLSMLYWIQRQKLPDHASNHHMIFDLTNTRLVKTRFIIKATITDELVSCSSTLGFYNFWKRVFRFRKLYLLNVQKILTCSRHQSLQKFEFQFSKALFLFIEGGQEHIFQIGPKNIFDQ